MSTRPLNILLANRANAFALSGGDTVVMRHLRDGLTARGHQVSCELSQQSLLEADLVHIINLTIRESEQFADAARACGKPYVVTTLYEDWPRYLNKSLQSIASFHRYITGGQHPDVLREEIAKIDALQGGPALERQRVVDGAAALFACGGEEAARLKNKFATASDRVRTARFGADGLPKATPASLLRMHNRVGFDTFILCCGRLETRKNQLMLLAALEDDDLPIVFATGSGSVQPVYIDLVQRFRRKGPVCFFENLAGVELAALMKLASVHVLPSWYELPGLVTMEALQSGTAAVAASWGAIQDYVTPPFVHMCEPNDPESIRNAVHSALAASTGSHSRTTATLPTWSEFIDDTLQGYEQILHRHPIPRATANHTVVKQNQDNQESNMNSPQQSFRFDVSIIIPCFNRAQLTKECIEQLCANDPAANYEVIFVDNGSNDETADILKAIEGDVKVVRFNHNRGFAVACNQAACIAEGKYFVFLNNDTLPQAGWLDQLLAAYARHPKAGAVGSLLLYPDGTVQHAGIAINERKVPYHIFQNFSAADTAVNDERAMTAVTGACMLVTADVFRTMGGFDENYLNGFEDVDFCMRLADAGFVSIYAPQSIVIHHEESSAGRKANDRQNFDRFMNRWGAQLSPNEAELCARYGYRIEWTDTGGKYYRTSAATSAKAAMQTVDVMLSAAQSLYATGQYREAADALQNVVQNSMTLAGDDGFEAWQTLGNCLTRLNRAEEAEKAFCEAIKLNEQSERPYLGLGTLAMIEENWLAAQYSFMTALAKSPGTTKGEFGVGLSLAARNRHEAALERFGRVIEKEPYNAEALFYFYRSAMEAGQPQLAVAPLETFVENNPANTNFIFHLCGAYWKAGDVLKAIDMCERVLKLDPNHAAANDIIKHFEHTLAVNA